MGIKYSHHEARGGHGVYSNALVFRFEFFEGFEVKYILKL